MKKRGNPNFVKGVSGNPNGRPKGTPNKNKLLVGEALAAFEAKTGRSFIEHYIKLAFIDKNVACDLAKKLYPDLKSIEGTLDVKQKILHVLGLNPISPNDDGTDNNA